MSLNTPLCITRAALLGLTTAALLAAPLASVAQTAPSRKAVAKAPVLPDLSPEQIATGERVLTGPQACEFNQTVDVTPGDKPGYFKVAHKGKTYQLAPEATDTGAVRLENKKAGIMWLQIANKSMLMNSKAGRRLVDECIHPTQRS